MSGHRIRAGALTRTVSFAATSLFGLGAALLSTSAYATTAVGHTAGSFAVSASGASTYTIPIWAPPGPQGIQPHIALSYNSQAGNGYIGVGWGLSGLSSISRCNLTFAQDAAPAPVALATSDGYCMDGQRLRLTSGTYGAAGSTYQTEIASFVNVTAYGTAGNGPAYFIAQDRNARTYTYGNGGNSQILATGSTTAISWQLNEVSDPAGNTMTIAYNTTTGSTPCVAGGNLPSGLSVPCTISWTPSSHGSSTYNYAMTFVYGTNVAPPQGYVGGTAQKNPNLLSSIAIAYSGTAVKTYYLTYQASPTTGRDELTQVQECAGTGTSNCFAPTVITYQNGAKGVSTSATSIPGAAYTHYDFNHDGYSDLLYLNGSTWYVAFGSATGYGTPVSTTIPSTASQVLPGNLLGTGQDGILAAVSGTWYYYSWNGSAFTRASIGLSYDSTASQYLLADVNGNGLPDLIASYFSSALVGGVTTYTFTVNVRLNTSSGSSVSFGNAIQAYQYSSTRLASVPVLASNTDNTGSYTLAFGVLPSFDFNGDGRDDLSMQWVTETPPGCGTQVVVQTKTVQPQTGCTYTLSTFELIAGGTIASPTFTAYGIYSASNYQALPVAFLNFNADACTDYLIGDTLYIAGCNGSTPSTISLGSANVIGAMDWNGDGLTDILVQNGSTVGVYLSTGSGLSSLVSTSVPYSTGNTYFTFDANGDGLDDLGYFGISGMGYYPHNSAAQPPDLMSSVTDAFGNSASPTYVPITQNNYTENGYATPPAGYQVYVGPMYVVNEAVSSDPSSASGGTYNETFWYYAAWTNLQGRGFQSFYAMRAIDSRNGVYAFNYYEQNFPYTGMDFEDTLSDNSGQTFNSAIRTLAPLVTLSSTQYEQRYFAYFNNVTKRNYEEGGTENGDLITTASTNYTFDNYGNATSIATTRTDNDPNSPYTGQSWTTTTTNTTDISTNQTADLAAWCLSMIDETQVAYTSTLSGSTAVTRTKTFTPDTPANCRITGSVTEPTANSGLYKVTESFGFDAFGNINSDTVTGANMPSSPASRLTSSNWGTTGQSLNTRADPSGAVTTWTYTSAQSLGFGVPDSIKDANNLTTSWTYDGFGRKTKETRPDLTSTTWALTACTSHCGWGNSEYQLAQTVYQTDGSTVIRTDNTLYDPVDRVTQTSGPSLTGTSVVVQKTYNSLGLLYQQSMPFFSGGTAYESTYTYDVLNRLTLAQRPISSSNGTLQSTTYQYAGRTGIVTDPYGNSKTTINDVNGWLRRTKDALGYYVTLSYDAAGSKTGVSDSVGNTLSTFAYKYGIAPFTVSTSDADLGAWTYTVDSLGEVVGWTDPKTESFSMTYDGLSRPLTRTEPDLVTQWTWGSTPASFNVGQLVTQCTAQVGDTCATGLFYSETRTFDSTGRLSTKAIKQAGNAGNDPGGVFLYTTAYSSTTGLPSVLTYPISTSGKALTIQYAYQYGLLQSLTDTLDSVATCGTTCKLWTASATDAFGHITQETLGNNVKTTRSFDAVTGLLNSATAGVGGGTGILNQSYLYDENGNVTQRQNNNAGLTENFWYDANYRLTCTSLTSSCGSPTVAYDGGVAGPGNITSQTGVGTYSYPAAGQPRPHAVTSITGSLNGIVNPVFSYDANGNMTARASATTNVTWSSYNYPTSVSGSDATGTETVQFSYGPDRKRWQQIYQGPSGTETTYYVGGLIDEVFSGSTTNYRHYIYAGNERIAVYSRTSGGTVTMSYMHADHQTSVSAITSSTGAVDVAESFTPFGNRRNPTTWSGPPSTSDLNTIAGLSREGYTLHTALGQSMGLNHMHGRVQDAITGRFISADPNIPDPTSAQSYNRYSYVTNNPLSFTDPSGFIARCWGCKPIDGYNPHAYGPLCRNCWKFTFNDPFNGVGPSIGSVGGFSFNNPDSGGGDDLAAYAAALDSGTTAAVANAFADAGDADTSSISAAAEGSISAQANVGVQVASNVQSTNEADFAAASSDGAPTSETIARAFDTVSEVGANLTKWAQVGQQGEALALDALSARGYIVLAQQLYVMTDIGLRVSDFVVTGGPAGTDLAGFEVKVNDSPYTPMQAAKDNLIATQGGTVVNWNQPAFPYGTTVTYTTYQMTIKRIGN